MHEDSSIVTDIARKCDADVAAAISRNMALVRGGANMAQVALMGAASALGSAAGAFLAVHDDKGGNPVSDEECADGFLLLMQPMLVRAIARLRASQKFTEHPGTRRRV